VRQYGPMKTCVTAAMRHLLSLFAIALIASLPLPAPAAELPYDEHANAADDVDRALQAARDAHKEVLLVFGANWCPDCRALDMALHAKGAAAVGQRFVVVKIDVGNFDKNVELAKRYQVPLRKGIPAAAVLGEDASLRYVTRSGELANARSMDDLAIADFLSHMDGGAPAGAAAAGH
jgi:thioredoxin 1